MAIRDRFALALAGMTVMALTTFAALAMVEQPTRWIDVTVLWLAGLLQLLVVLAWVFMPRLRRWIIGGWGLILIATGLGVIISAPVPAGASVMPWALIGLVIVGIVTIIVAIAHTPARSDF
jgi:hypothetical protein